MWRDNNTVETQSTVCGNCGEEIVWRSDDDCERFIGAVSKLIHHINHDKECLRIKKLSILDGTNKKLAQDYCYESNILKI